MPRWLSTAIAYGTRVLMPEVCAGCGVAESWVCSDCWSAVSPVDATTCCNICGHPADTVYGTCERCKDWGPGAMLVRSAFVFSGPMRHSISRMKYRGEFARASWHAEHLASVVSEAGWTGIDLVVPVPLHRKKLKKRGYNQSEKLALHLAKLLEVEMDQPLERIRETQSQTTLGRDERIRNVDGAFTATRRLDGLSVLLVDDVATTCSTLLASASACTVAGADSVFAVTIATQGA